MLLTQQFGETTNESLSIISMRPSRDFNSALLHNVSEDHKISLMDVSIMYTV